MPAIQRPLDILVSADTAKPVDNKPGGTTLTDSKEKEISFDKVLAKEQDRNQPVVSESRKSADEAQPEAVAKAPKEKPTDAPISELEAQVSGKELADNGKELPPELPTLSVALEVEPVEDSEALIGATALTPVDEAQVVLVDEVAIAATEAPLVVAATQTPQAEAAPHPAEQNITLQAPQLDKEVATKPVQPLLRNPEVADKVELKAEPLTANQAQRLESSAGAKVTQEAPAVPLVAPAATAAQVESAKVVTAVPGLELDAKTRVPQVPTVPVADADFQEQRLSQLLSGKSAQVAPESAKVRLEQPIELASKPQLELGQELKQWLMQARRRTEASTATSFSQVVDTPDASQNMAPVTARIQGLAQAVQALTGAPRVETPALTVPVPVQGPEWGQLVSQRISWLAGNGFRGAELHLNPPELGPVEVKISVTQDQASVHFTSAHAQVRDALELSANRLREMMESHGLDLTDVNVSDQSASQQGDSERPEERALARGSQQEESAPTLVASTRVSQSLVDYYA